jgi:glycosyltransferase involved in cell wall biosynthesis
VARRLFIHAVNVHQGGGRSLLLPIIESLPADMESILCLDSRMQLPENMRQEIRIRHVRPTVFHRFMVEVWLLNKAAQGDVVLCFGNLPPLFRLHGHAVVFVQNRYLVDAVKLYAFPLKTQMRLFVERIWFSRKMVNADEFIVQTPSMKNLLDARTNEKIPVRILPFVATKVESVRSARSPKVYKEKFNFVYVASGEPHKNHRQLIEAWCLLAKEGLFPSLKLTLLATNFPVLCDWLGRKIKQFELNVENVGSVPHAQVGQLYEQADALIYPSTFESFGLPLIEASQAGLPVLAPELDYVRDVIAPEQTFDPESAVSITRAVKRFMGVDEQALPLLNAAGFIENILERVK